MRKLELQEVKKIELEILIEFCAFCKNNNLRFYLAGGTLLGAIRHHGFIPWDDDIDVCMPRPDYKKLLKLFPEESRYTLRIKELGNFNAPFAKIVDNRTEIDTKYVDTSDEKHLWIDIFPVDGLPDDIEEVKSIYSRCNFWRRAYMLTVAKLGEGKNIIKKYAKFIFQPIVRFYGASRCIAKIEKIAAQYKYEDSNYVGIVTWGFYGVGERMLKSEFEQDVEVEFEGHKFPAFSCWDSYLKGLYGDYMKLPPIEKRKTHDMVAYVIDEK